jgi:hypothetical protein
MDKSLLIFIAIGMGALFLVTNFIGDIQEEDDAYRNNDYAESRQYDQYQKVDSIGQAILVFENADESTQVAAWQASPIKQEFLELFPNYSEMKEFVRNRTVGKALQSKILKIIDDVEGKFFSGTLSPDEAKQKLDSLH